MKKLVLLFVFILSISISKSQNFEWAKLIRSTGNNDCRTVAQDTAGSIYYAGQFDGTADFDPGPGIFNLTSAPNDDIYIVKLDSAGNFIWVKQFGGAGYDFVNSISLDDSMNIYFTGTFEDTADFDPGVGIYNIVSAGQRDIFVTKLNSNGDLIWAKQIGSSGYDFGRYVYLDSSSFFLLGDFNGTVDLDPNAGVLNATSSGGADMFISKFDLNGNLIWAKKFDGTSDDNAYKMDLDPSGNILMTGIYWGTTDLDPGVGVQSFIATGTGRDIFVVKLDPNGNYIWAFGLSGPGAFDLGSAIKTDASGNVYYAGRFDATIDFDPGPGVLNLSTPGISYENIYVSKLDPNGNLVWAKSMNCNSSAQVTDIQLDSLNNIYATGDFYGTNDFDTGAGTNNISASGCDAFIFKLDSLGNSIWAGSMKGTGGVTFGYSLLRDKKNNLLMAGTFTWTIDANPNVGVYNLGVSGFNVYLIKLNQDGCSNFAVAIDSVQNLSCTTLGYASSHSFNGLAPNTYEWNTSPPTLDSIVTMGINGIYQLTVTDANGCSRSSAVLINGPTYFSGFDVEVNAALTNFRLGKMSNIWLDVFNDGCLPASGKLMLINDSITLFDHSIPPPDSIAGDTIFWNFNNLVYESPHLITQTFLFVPFGATIGDTVCYTALVAPAGAGELDTINNIRTYCAQIKYPYDPNDKKVYPVGKCSQGYIPNGEKLTYTIRFQNTGTAEAFDIYVLDTLDADLNINSARVIGNSDPIITEVLPGNVLKFRFDNIHLPDSASNEPESHGYLIFEALPLPGLANGTEIKNDVGIYFDLNSPVYTNTVLNTISDGVIDNTTTISGITITANLSGTNYQWLDCNNGDTLIAGATNQSFTPTTNGNYSVIVSNGCFSDTSACVAITTIGINELSSIPFISIYPNPASNNIIITTKSPTTIKIVTILGETVLTKKIETKADIDVHSFSNGIYYIQTTEGLTYKFIKQ
jgi:uncharacterized repeat protein (TIGR01451 family)